MVGCCPCGADTGTGGLPPGSGFDGGAPGQCLRNRCGVLGLPVTLVPRQLQMEITNVTEWVGASAACRSAINGTVIPLNWWSPIGWIGQVQNAALRSLCGPFCDFTGYGMDTIGAKLVCEPFSNGFTIEVQWGRFDIPTPVICTYGKLNDPTAPPPQIFWDPDTCDPVVFTGTQAHVGVNIFKFDFTITEV